MGEVGVEYVSVTCVILWRLARVDDNMTVNFCKQISGLIQNCGYFGISYSVTQYISGGLHNRQKEYAN
jgi:hypothetical protein